MKKLENIFILLIITSILLAGFQPANSVYADTKSETVLLAQENDPYYALAEEIAAEEGLEIYHSVDEALKRDPVYLLWVVSPQHLSTQVMVDFSYKIKEVQGSLSVGIFSGVTLADARGLWLRARDHYIPADEYVLINGSGATQKYEAEIISKTENGDETVIPLSKETLIHALADNTNVQISLEGTATSWFEQHAEITIHDEDIPQLDDAVILHYGCSTFQPWEAHSIANACIQQGALAYMGFIYPSIVGNSFGSHKYNGLVYTWEKFPIGHLVAAQNKAVMQSYTDAAHFYLLGDPRIYRHPEQPYTLVRDEMDGGTRILELSNVPEGIIPVYVPDGAGYDFVSIDGVTSSSMAQPFFNRYVQMINIHGDKFILIENNQENIHIELQEKAPLLWQLSSNTVNFLDAIVVDSMHADIYVLFLPIIGVLLLIRGLRKRLNRKHLGMAAIFGAFMALIPSLYSLLRMQAITISNAPLTFNFLFPLNTFVCVTYGLMLYLDAKSGKGKIVGLLISNMYSLFVILFFGIAMLVKLMMVGNTASVEKFTYPWLFPLEKLVLGLIIYGLLYWQMRKRCGKGSILNEGNQ
jgi:hypothetical protein